MLLSYSLSAMRYMLKVCDDFAVEYDIKFNTGKSVAMRIGPRYNMICEPLELWQKYAVRTVSEIFWHKSSIKQKY